ncbi:MAG: hypothetical protein ACFB6R_10235 [Alphaproteobacteria bacterium]
MAISTHCLKIVGPAANEGGKLGAPGAFVYDYEIHVLVTVWTAALLGVARQNRLRITPAFSADVAASVAAGVNGYIGRAVKLMKALQTIPGAGQLTSMGVNSVITFIYTYKFGKACCRLMDAGRFNTDDVDECVTDILAKVLSLPTPDEMVDMLRIKAMRIDEDEFGTMLDMAAGALRQRTRDGGSGGAR